MMREIKIDGQFGDVILKHYEDKEFQTPLASDQDIQAIVEAVGAGPLPADYMAYLKTINGGKVEPRGVRYSWTPEDIRKLQIILSPTDEIIADPAALVSCLLSAGCDRKGADILSSYRLVVPWMQPGYLPIADTSIGDQIVMNLNEGEDYGSIHYMTLQGVAALIDMGETNPLGFIAPDFTTFTTLFFDLDSIIADDLAEFLRQRGQ